MNHSLPSNKNYKKTVALINKLKSINGSIPELEVVNLSKFLDEAKKSILENKPKSREDIERISVVLKRMNEIYNIDYDFLLSKLDIFFPVYLELNPEKGIATLRQYMNSTASDNLKVKLIENFITIFPDFDKNSDDPKFKTLDQQIKNQIREIFKNFIENYPLKNEIPRNLIEKLQIPAREKFEEIIFKEKGEFDFYREESRPNTTVLSSEFHKNPFKFLITNLNETNVDSISLLIKNVNVIEKYVEASKNYKLAGRIYKNLNLSTANIFINAELVKYQKYPESLLLKQLASMISKNDPRVSLILDSAGRYLLLSRQSNQEMISILKRAKVMNLRGSDKIQLYNSIRRIYYGSKDIRDHTNFICYLLMHINWLDEDKKGDSCIFDEKVFNNRALLKIANNKNFRRKSTLKIPYKNGGEKIDNRMLNEIKKTDKEPSKNVKEEINNDKGKESAQDLKHLNLSDTNLCFSLSPGISELFNKNTGFLYLYCLKPWAYNDHEKLVNFIFHFNLENELAELLKKIIFICFYIDERQKSICYSKLYGLLCPTNEIARFLYLIINYEVKSTQEETQVKLSIPCCTRLSCCIEFLGRFKNQVPSKYITEIKNYVESRWCDNCHVIFHNFCNLNNYNWSYNIDEMLDLLKLGNL